MNNLEIATELYRAFLEQDASGLARLMHPSFTARVSEGMPCGVGGIIDGPEAMLRDVWGRIASKYDVTPVPTELVPASDGRVFAIGRYRGKARAGGPVDAAFVHVLSFRDGRVVAVEQVTDTSRWHDALAGASPA